MNSRIWHRNRHTPAGLPLRYTNRNGPVSPVSSLSSSDDRDDARNMGSDSDSTDNPCGNDSDISTDVEAQSRMNNNSGQ